MRHPLILLFIIALGTSLPAVAQVSQVKSNKHVVRKVPKEPRRPAAGLKNATPDAVIPQESSLRPETRKIPKVVIVPAPPPPPGNGPPVPKKYR